MANAKTQARREVALKSLETQIKDCKTKLAQTNNEELKDQYLKKVGKKEEELHILLERLGRKLTVNYPTTGAEANTPHLA